ncbi:MAG: hypothetical protein AB7T86_02585 [Xanthobacteraceae bacterium]|uniref:hypothetical protein n=1 Tax=Pseudolabrys sp. TaxID=1960880 RepID=UPI003D152B9D
MQATKTADAGSGRRGKGPELDERYAEIGISAVAAAIRYQGDCQRNPARPSVSSGRDEDE